MAWWQIALIVLASFAAGAGVIYLLIIRALWGMWSHT